MQLLPSLRLATQLLCTLALSTAAELTMMDRLRQTQQIVHQAFAQKPLREELVLEALKGLQVLAPFVSRVVRGGWQSKLFDEQGALEYELSQEDHDAVSAYMNEHVFVLPDLLSLALLSPDELHTALKEEDAHPVLRRRRIVSALRNSWWLVLTTDTAVWDVPFFGALASVAQKLRNITKYPEDAYRDSLWELAAPVGTSSYPGMSAAMHWREVSKPLLTWEYSQPTAFRLACAWLAVAGGQKSAVEAAERHFRAFEQMSLRAILELAAEWPLFDLLHSLALEADTLQGDAEPPAMDPTPPVLAAPASTAEQSLGSEEVLELYRMLHTFGALCDAMKIRWWVSHGTLIGALRDGGLSRHAEDCEVDVPEADVPALQGPRMRRALGRNGYELSYDPRGRCFKIWPAGSPQAEANGDDQLVDQTWWLPQQRIGTPSLDVYIVETPSGPNMSRHYISNEEFHCNSNVCTQMWHGHELSELREVKFGLSRVQVPVGAPSYLTRVYGSDWNVMVRAHRWADEQGRGFVAMDVSQMPKRTAEPLGPLLPVILPQS